MQALWLNYFFLLFHKSIHYIYNFSNWPSHLLRVGYILAPNWKVKAPVIIYTMYCKNINHMPSTIIKDVNTGVYHACQSGHCDKVSSHYEHTKHFYFRSLSGMFHRWCDFNIVPSIQLYKSLIYKIFGISNYLLVTFVHCPGLIICMLYCKNKSEWQQK